MAYSLSSEHASSHVSSGVFVFQAEDGIRDLVRSRGLGDVYKRQAPILHTRLVDQRRNQIGTIQERSQILPPGRQADRCLLYTSDAADERSSVDLGGRRIIKKKTNARDNADV